MAPFRRSELLLPAPASTPDWRWPAWCLRLSLRWTTRCIEQVEAQLADDFALDATAPLHRELESLRLEHDGLTRRLADLSAH